MASAFIRIGNVYPTETGIAVELAVSFTGADVPNRGLTAAATIEFAGAVQPAALRTQMSAAVTAEALRYGFTCVGADMVLPAFQKG